VKPLGLMVNILGAPFYNTK